MARVKIGPANPDRKAVDVEIARLRELDADALRLRWHKVYGRLAVHVPGFCTYKCRRCLTCCLTGCFADLRARD